MPKALSSVLHMDVDGDGGCREPHMSGDSGIATTTLGDTRLSIRQDIRDVFTRIEVIVNLFTTRLLYMFRSGSLTCFLFPYISTCNQE